MCPGGILAVGVGILGLFLSANLLSFLWSFGFFLPAVAFAEAGFLELWVFVSLGLTGFQFFFIL
jgi:hypothetical protein